MTARASRRRVVGIVTDLFDAMTIAEHVKHGRLTASEAKGLILSQSTRGGTKVPETRSAGRRGVAA